MEIPPRCGRVFTGRDKLDAPLHAIVKALRTSKPIPHGLPVLRAAHNLIEDRYGLFGVETDRLVTAWNTLREQAEKTAPSLIPRRDESM